MTAVLRAKPMGPYADAAAHTRTHASHCSLFIVLWCRLFQLGQQCCPAPAPWRLLDRLVSDGLSPRAGISITFLLTTHTHTRTHSSGSARLPTTTARQQNRALAPQVYGRYRRIGQTFVHAVVVDSSVLPALGNGDCSSLITTQLGTPNNNILVSAPFHGSHAESSLLVQQMHPALQ